MKDNNRDIEVKFPIPSAEDILSAVTAIGAVCEQPVRFERNLRFDDEKDSLSSTKQVLRLRNNGGTAILTYKSDKNSSGTLADREEIETVVGDFARTQLILERLGFRTVFIYEKIRSIYSFGPTGIFVDHTPIGDYVEIEGPDEETIRKTAERLSLDWDSRSGAGYRALFKKWKKESGFPGRDMTFIDITGSEPVL